MKRKGASAVVPREPDSERRLATRTQLMHRVHESDRVIDWRFLEDAVPQIKDVPRTPVRQIQNLANTAANRLSIRQQYTRIEISLDGAIEANLSPSLVQIDSPIQPNNGRAALGHQRQQRWISGGKTDDGNPGNNATNDLLYVGQHVGSVFGGPQTTDPGIKELNALSASDDLSVQIDRY